MIERIHCTLAPARGRVERDQRIISGVSIAQAAEAKGHNLRLDQASLLQLVELAQKLPRGLKCRFAHPGLGVDGLGRYLGRFLNTRLEGERVLADLHLAEVSFHSPAGDLGSYVLDLAEQDPDAFGVSLVMDVQRLLTPTAAAVSGAGSAALPTVRILRLYAADLVDEPAINAGLFAELRAVRRPAPQNSVAENQILTPQINQGATMETEQTLLNETQPPVDSAEPAAPQSPWAPAFQSVVVQLRLKNSGLPEVVQKRLADQAYASPEELESSIDTARAELAALQEQGVVKLPGGARQVSQRSGFEELNLALEALAAGENPGQGVRPLSGLREFYLLISGDYEMQGVFHPERVQFASVNSATMAGLVANALNKRVMSLFQNYPAWWEPAVTVEDFSSLQQVKWVTLGGLGELPTVEEGGSYQEMSWDDKTETASFIKKGGYLGITLEAMDKDDTRRLQLAPRALAQAAWMTLGKSIAAIFTSNPTMSDSVALFHASHSNLGSSALSFSAWSATRTAMQKQTELNSGERLGALVSPHLLWVPLDLETTAEQVLASAHNPGEGTTTSFEAVNPFAEGESRETRLRRARQRIIKVPFWTDVNDWVAQADPLLYPSLGLAFRYGRTPEVFSVASPLAGLMFTNDTLPVKVRFFYAVGPMDYRGFYKHVVS